MRAFRVKNSMIMDNNLAEFRDIPGYEGLYQVNLINQVKNVKYNRILSGSKNINSEHIHFNLSNSNGLFKCFGIHQLVAITWNLPNSHLPVVKHIDNDPTNNHWNNLEYDTQKNNTIEAYRDGLCKNGSKHTCSKLTEEQVLEIRASKLRNFELAKIHGVASSVISLIKSRKTWKHI